MGYFIPKLQKDSSNLGSRNEVILSVGDFISQNVTEMKMIVFFDLRVLSPQCGNAGMIGNNIIYN